MGTAGSRFVKRGHVTVSGLQMLDDDQEELRFTHNPQDGLAAIDFTDYPYGTNFVVRVTEIELQ
jgi:hypothetical protein